MDLNIVWPLLKRVKCAEDAGTSKDVQEDFSKISNDSENIKTAIIHVTEQYKYQACKHEKNSYFSVLWTM